MRQNARHARGRRNNNNNNGNRRVNPRVHSFDSNGPDVRIRGNAYQVTEKYITLARDAASAGDHVLAESYFQHAEHYQRIINISLEEQSSNNNFTRNNNSQNNGQSQQPSDANGEDAGSASKAKPEASQATEQEGMEDLDQAFLRNGTESSNSGRGNGRSRQRGQSQKNGSAEAGNAESS